MKKILIGIITLLILSGCGEETKTLSCSSTSEANGMRTNTKYEIKYIDDEIKHITVTYDYNQNTTEESTDGTNANTSGLDQNETTNNNTLNSDDVVDGVVGDAIDDVIDGVQNTILDLAGIKNTYQNRMNTYNNIEGFNSNIEVDNDKEYKFTYDIDMNKISDEDLAQFNIGRDLSTLRTNYENTGFTCE